MTALIADLFANSARTAEGVPRLADDEIYPEEREYISRAVPKRRAEFATARLLARQALSALGATPAALVPGPDFAPTWPPGVVGSISHTTGYCAVVVNSVTSVRSVGLDVETLRPLDPSVAAAILTPRERAWLRTQEPSGSDELVALFFSAKEAFYKCQYPLTRRFLDFQDVELEIDRERGLFTVRVQRSISPHIVAPMRGKFAFRAAMVLAGVELLTSRGSQRASVPDCRNGQPDRWLAVKIGANHSG